MALLILILQIIGAIPDIIALVKKIWELIQEIRNRRERLAATKKLRETVLRHLADDKKSVKDNQACMADLIALQLEVEAILKAQG